MSNQQSCSREPAPVRYNRRELLKRGVPALFGGVLVACGDTRLPRALEELTSSERSRREMVREIIANPNSARSSEYAANLSRVVEFNDNRIFPFKQNEAPVASTNTARADVEKIMSEEAIKRNAARFNGSVVLLDGRECNFYVSGSGPEPMINAGSLNVASMVAIELFLDLVSRLPRDSPGLKIANPQNIEGLLGQAYAGLLSDGTETIILSTDMESVVDPTQGKFVKQSNFAISGLHLDASFRREIRDIAGVNLEVNQPLVGDDRNKLTLVGKSGSYWGDSGILIHELFGHGNTALLNPTSEQRGGFTTPHEHTGWVVALANQTTNILIQLGLEPIIKY